MGLLPTGTGDWLAFETRNPVSNVLVFFRLSQGLMSCPEALGNLASLMC